MNHIKIIQVLYIYRSNVVPILLKTSNWMIVYVTKKKHEILIIFILLFEIYIL